MLKESPHRKTITHFDIQNHAHILTFSCNNAGLCSQMIRDYPLFHSTFPERQKTMDLDL
jgi:hypothetical protein